MITLAPNWPEHHDKNVFEYTYFIKHELNIFNTSETQKRKIVDFAEQYRSI